jgi:hypothetical protein
MRKLLFSAVAIAALAFVAASPSPSQASWLSQALHAYYDPVYSGSYYDYPPYGSYAPAYSSYYAPYYGYAPSYGYYGSYYYAPPRTSWYGPRYYGSWYGNPHWQHEWQERREHARHEWRERQGHR